MFRFNGIGTTLLGKKDFNKDNSSYISTKWFTIVFFPIIPLTSYRVTRTEKSKKFWTGGFPEYQMLPMELDKQQIIKTYIIWWIIPLILVILYFL